MKGVDLRIVDLKPSPTLRRDDERSARGTLLRSLRPVRIVLSAAFVALVALSPGEDLTLDGLVVLFFAGIALLNVAFNAALIALGRTAPRRELLLAQLGADALLAIMGMLILDAGATPLAWVALLLPIFDAGIVFGTVAAGITWGGLSILYIALRLQTTPDPESDTAVLRLALQQLAAVAAVAVPTGYVAAKLRDDLERADEARTVANRRVQDLLRVAVATRELNEATEPLKVLDVTLRAAVALGFERVDVCERQDRRAWRVLRAAGSGKAPDAGGDVHLDQALAAGRAIVIGSAESPQQLQELHLLGLGGGVVLPLSLEPRRQLALRAWSRQPLAPGESRLESLELLGSMSAGTWHNVLTVGKLEAWSERLEHDATHDMLTGLANRARLIARLDESLERLQNVGTPFSVLFLDLDGFKQVNDGLGHDAGDAVLQAVAKRLEGVVRGHDVLARIGGDEFVVVLNDIAAPEYARTVADRICAVVASEYSVGGATATLGVSVGIAHATPTTTVEQLLSAADRVMYEAKKGGGGRYAVQEQGVT